MATAEPPTTARLNGTSVTAGASGLPGRVPCKDKAARVMAELVAAVFRNAPMVPWRSAGNRHTAGGSTALVPGSAMRNAAVSGAVSPAIAKAGAGAWAGLNTSLGKER